MNNAIQRLHDLGQSVWLDHLDHRTVASGELEHLVREGLGGVTSNPTIFEKAISGARADYDEVIAGMGNEDPRQIFEAVEVREVALACDVLRPLYDRTEGADGFVSIEVAPGLAHDTAGSIAEARRLWSRVGRPNLMVKIPGTREGLGAIEQCLAAGINVNVTLLFSVARYEEVVSAFLRALEARRNAGLPLERMASVASFFVSRVDTKIDQALARAGAGADLRGRAAIANAKLAYETWERTVTASRWDGLASKGARPQRLLWASTSPKDPAYQDLYYADALIGAHTVDTMTKATLAALLQKGAPPRATLTEGRDEARRLLGTLPSYGIDLAAVLQELEDEGVEAFAKSYDKACATIANSVPCGKRPQSQPVC